MNFLSRFWLLAMVTGLLACESNMPMPSYLSGYLQLKDALVAGDFDLVQASASNIITAIDSLGQGGPQATIAQVAKAIAGADGIDAQRKLLPELTNAYRGLLSNADLPHPTLYYQYCPMAFDNQGGYWISDKEEIMNPYFGDQMLHCGVVKETF